MSPHPVLTLRKGRLRRIVSGHPWVFSNELEEVPDLQPGCLVEIAFPDGKKAGIAIVNPSTLIACRWLKRGEGPLPDRWLEDRLDRAASRRESSFPGEDCLRLVHGEADALPGLVVDRYGGALSIQILTAGMERLRGRIGQALRDRMAPDAMAFQDDSPFRAMEGLPTTPPPEAERAPDTTRVSYQGLTLDVPLRKGQKTGLYLDQRENVHTFLDLLPPGTRVLDVFAYMGIWGMAALKAGAADAEFVEASAPACERIDRGLRDNRLGDREIHNGDAFRVLRALRAAGKRFGAVVVDPPAFAKSRKHVKEALKAYRHINELALALVEPGGILVSCSCSHHIAREDLRLVLSEAAAKSRRAAELVEVRGQASDHPVLLHFPEGEYLKAFFLRLD